MLSWQEDNLAFGLIPFFPQNFQIKLVKFGISIRHINNCSEF